MVEAWWATGNGVLLVVCAHVEGHRLAVVRAAPVARLPEFPVQPPTFVSQYYLYSPSIDGALPASAAGFDQPRVRDDTGAFEEIRPGIHEDPSRRPELCSQIAAPLHVVVEL